MHHLRMHGDGIGECPTCGAIYRIVAEHARREDQDDFDCLMCGQRLDDMAGNTQRVYELVAITDIGHAMTL